MTFTEKIEALELNPRVKVARDHHFQQTPPEHPFGSAGCVKAERTWRGWWEA